MKQVIERIGAILADNSETQSTVVALQAAESVTRTAGSGELNTLATLVPLVLERVHVEGTCSAALAALLSMR